MNVTCPACKTRYSVDDARVPPSGVTIKCPKCGHKFVAKPPRAASAVALPGSVGAAEPGASGSAGPIPLPQSRPAAAAPPPARARSAVALPGSVSAGQSPDFDVGLDADVPLPAPRREKQGSALGGDEVLDFINEKAGMAQMEGMHPELKIRRRNGRVEGPYGLGRIRAMLRNKELQGSEDISEDGMSWRAMTSHPELNAVLNELHAADDLGFGNIDLPISASTDLPIPSTLPEPRGPAPSTNSLDFSSNDLDTADIGSAPPAPHRIPYPAGGRLPQSGSSGPLGPTTGPLGELGSSPLDASLGLDDALAEQAVPLEADLGSSGRDLARELEVGDVPDDLPPVWQTYRNQIIAFAVAVTVVLVGVYTQFFTSAGAYGIPALVSVLTTKPPAPPPAAPPPAPAKVADPREVANLIDEHSYESFRSVFATLNQAGADLADNRLALAKAHGFATLAFGDKVFPVADLASAVEALNTVDLSQAFNGDAAAANVAFAKARMALEILAGAPDRAANQLTALVESHGEDKELALLLGLARMKLNQPDGAVAALDRALIVAPKYAPVLHAIGQAVEAIGGPNAAADAVEWYVKALDANPKHSRSGLSAARILAAEQRFGRHRRIMKRTAAHADRGLPPDQRPALYYQVARVFDEQGRLSEVAQFAQEAARLRPGNNSYVAIGAAAMAEAGQAREALALIEPVVARSPNSVDVRIARARVFFKLDDIAKGFMDLEKARQAAPNDHRIPLWEGTFHANLGKFKDARKALSRAAQTADKDAMPHIALGRLELRLGNVDIAYASADRAVSTAPNEARAHTLLGDCYVRRGQLLKAQESFVRAFTLDDEALDARLGYANALRDLSEKENRAARAKSLAKAIPLYLNAMRDNPDNPQIMFEYGRALELQGDLRGAVAQYQDAARVDAKDVRPHLKMIAAYLDPATLDIVAAKRSLKRAKDIETAGGISLPEVSFWEARVAHAAKDRRRAVVSMRAAVDAQPTNARYQFWMGQVLEADSMIYEAIKHYEQAVRLNSRYAEPLRALGRLALDRKLFNKARKYFAQYQKAAPDDASVFIDIGDSYTMQNRDKLAESAYRRALQALPRNATALLQLGNILDRRGQSKGALKKYLSAAAADPTLGEAVCKSGLALDKGKVTRRNRRYLESCVDLERSPEDLRQVAAEMLATPQ